MHARRCTEGHRAFAALAGAYADKGRVGVAEFAAGVEAYVLPAGRLANRLLKTARRAAPAGLREGVPEALSDPSSRMLLLFIHRRVRLPRMLCRRQSAGPCRAARLVTGAALAGVHAGGCLCIQRASLGTGCPRCGLWRMYGMPSLMLHAGPVLPSLLGSQPLTERL